MARSKHRRAAVASRLAPRRRGRTGRSAGTTGPPARSPRAGSGSRRRPSAAGSTGGSGERFAWPQSHRPGHLTANATEPAHPHPSAARGSPGRAQRRGGPPPGRGCGGPWGRPAGRHPRRAWPGAPAGRSPPPGPAALRGAALASSATAMVTRSGRSSCGWSIVAVRWVSFGTAVPFWSSDLAVARHLPHGRHQAGTATSTSTGIGTTSGAGASASVTGPLTSAFVD
jgi:hypothetical protein